MSERPAFGTAPIRCSKRSCKWKGYETEMKKVPHPTLGSFATQNVCPVCGCDSYYFMTPKEVAAWERTKAAPASVLLPSNGVMVGVASASDTLRRLTDEELAGHLRSLGSITWRDCWNLAEHLRREGVIALDAAMPRETFDEWWARSGFTKYKDTAQAAWEAALAALGVAGTDRGQP